MEVVNLKLDIIVLMEIKRKHVNRKSFLKVELCSGKMDMASRLLTEVKLVQ